MKAHYYRVPGKEMAKLQPGLSLKEAVESLREQGFRVLRNMPAYIGDSVIIIVERVH